MQFFSRLILANLVVVLSFDSAWTSTTISSLNVAPTDATLNSSLPENVYNNLNITHKLSSRKCDKNRTLECVKLGIINTTTSRPTVRSGSITTAPILKTTTTSPSLISRTTDAIYRVISGVFAQEGDIDTEHEEADESSEVDEIQATTVTYNSTRRLPTTPNPASGTTNVFKSKLDTRTTSVRPTRQPPSTIHPTTSIRLSTIAPSEVQISTTMTSLTSQKPSQTIPVGSFTTTRTPTTSSTPSITTKNNTSELPERKLTQELLSIINMAYKSLDKLRESASGLNRSTRVAPKQVVDNPDALEREISSISELDKSERLQMSPSEQTGVKSNTEQEVHLLCKLLHKHFDLNRSNATGLSSALTTLLATESPSATTTTTTTTTHATTSAEPSQEPTSTILTPTQANNQTPRSRQLVSSLRELEVGHESELLETILSMEPARERDWISVERSAQQLMTNLYNSAAKLRAAGQLQRPALVMDSESLITNDYIDNDDSRLAASTTQRSAGQQVSSNFTLPEAPYKLKVWHKASDMFQTHVHLVYWLLEQRLYSNNNNDELDSIVKYRVVDWHKARDLLHRYLSQEEITKQLEQFKFLGNIGDLVFAHNPNKSYRDHDHKHVEEQPQVFDDSLAQPGPNDNPKASPSAFQTLLDRFSHNGFHDDLQFYLIIFIIVLFLIVLLFCLVPMLCYKREQAPSSQARSTSGRAKHTARARRPKEAPSQPAQSEPALSESYPKVQSLGEGSIWRKLSNTTTTLVKDQSEVIKDEGNVRLPLDRKLIESQQAFAISGKRAPFEWYSFEDRHEQKERRVDPAKPTQAYVISDKRHITKSVQTFDPVQLEPPEEDFQMNFTNRLENRGSNTLTKSELVMLKEKLIPVALKKAPVSPPDYVNQRHWMESRASQTSGLGEDNLAATVVDDKSPPTPLVGMERSTDASYIDKNSSSSGSGSNASGKLNTVIEASPRMRPARESSENERRPKMRHVELEPRTRDRVEAIRSELGQLEQRDRELTGSGPAGLSEYKRYDVI